MSLGEILKKRREDLGLSFEDIYNMSRIRHVFLKALEEERWDEFPSASQAKAFLKKYIRILNLPEDILKEYEEFLPVGQPEFKMRSRMEAYETKKPSKWIIALIVVVIFTAIGYGLWYKGLFGVVNLPQNKIASNKVGGTEATPSTQPVGIPKEENLEAASNPNRATLPTEIRQAGSPPEGHRLSLVCNERSWVRIYLDQEPVKDYLFNPGDKYEWVAKEGLEIKIGNAAGVELEYNGKKYKSLGKKGQVVLLRFPETFQRRVGY